MLGVANITFDGAFVVTGITIRDGKNGLFCSMPSRKTNTGEYKDIAFPLSKELRTEIQLAVISAYVAGGDKPQQKREEPKQVESNPFETEEGNEEELPF